MKYLNVNKLIKELETRISFCEDDIKLVEEEYISCDDFERCIELSKYIDMHSSLCEGLKKSLYLIKKYSFDEVDF